MQPNPEINIMERDFNFSNKDCFRFEIKSDNSNCTTFSFKVKNRIENPKFESDSEESDETEDGLESIECFD